MAPVRSGDDGRLSTALRRAVLEFSLREPGPLADLTVSDQGVCLPDGVQVRWTEVWRAGIDPVSATRPDPAPTLYRRVARWLRLRHTVGALLTAQGEGAVRARIRPLALPHDHQVHPGWTWPVHRVLGGAIDLGLGLRGVDDDGRPDPEGVGVLPVELLACAGVTTAPLCDAADRYLQDMAALAAERLLRSRNSTLRPLGDCDVVTLLAAESFRHAVVQDAPGVVGLRSAAVPVRRLGWLDLGRVDPAFALAAATLTEPDERGFLRPLLITADEIVQVRDGGAPVRFALADPPAPEHPSPVQRLN